jgi:hypothetical protein
MALEGITHQSLRLPPVRRPDSPRPFVTSLPPLPVGANDLPQHGDLFLRLGGGVPVDARKPSYQDLKRLSDSRRVIDDNARSMPPPPTLPTPIHLTPNAKVRTPGKTRLGLPSTFHKEGVMATVL